MQQSLKFEKICRKYEMKNNGCRENLQMQMCMEIIIIIKVFFGNYLSWNIAELKGFIIIEKMYTKFMNVR